MAREELVENLNKALSYELAGVIQYSQHSYLITGPDREVFKDFFREMAEEAQDHAEVLGDKVVALGGIPTVEPAMIRQSTELKEMLKQGLELDPGLQTLSASLKDYEAEIKKRERELRLQALFNSLDSINVAQVQQDLAGLKADFPDRFDAMVERFSGARANQLRSYARTRDVEVGVLAARSNEFARLFPKAGAALARPVISETA